VELEEAWADLWFCKCRLECCHEGPLLIRADDGVRIPENKLYLINRTADLGNGKHLKPVEDEEGGYHSMFEVFHQLHCLVSASNSLKHQLHHGYGH
jgi:hypothetical protein